MPCLGKPETPEPTDRSRKAPGRAGREEDPPRAWPRGSWSPSWPPCRGPSIQHLPLSLCARSPGPLDAQPRHRGAASKKRLLMGTRRARSSAGRFLAPTAGTSPAGPHGDRSFAQGKAQSSEASPTRSRGGMGWGEARRSSPQDSGTFPAACPGGPLGGCDYSSCPFRSLFRVLGAQLRQVAKIGS